MVCIQYSFIHNNNIWQNSFNNRVITDSCVFIGQIRKQNLIMWYDNGVSAGIYLISVIVDDRFQQKKSIISLYVWFYLGNYWLYVYVICFILISVLWLCFASKSRYLLLNILWVHNCRPSSTAAVYNITQWSAILILIVSNCYFFLLYFFSLSVLCSKEEKSSSQTNYWKNVKDIVFCIWVGKVNFKCKKKSFIRLGSH